jgi:FtsP/CotA-like multicopper oxidase with cupredoxin domain
VSDRLPDPEQLASATWQEPWTWRPHQWPGRRLQLNVTRGQNPGFSPSPASFSSKIFSFGGISPGPTIRVRNDDVLRLTVRNTLSMNHGQVEVGPFPAALDSPPALRRKICELVEEQTGFRDPDNPDGCFVFVFPEQVREVVNAELKPNWHIGGHLNRFHAAHTTNIHTHGLHVQPQANADGTHSDNIFLRIIPQGDFEKRKQELGEDADVLNDREFVGELDYDFHLSYERGGKRLPHPPGTHWYHPHSHGSTHLQVSSGMAGFLLVEGDVDQAINRTMTGEDWPDPELPSGPWDYRERLLMLQRVFVASADTDAPAKKRNLMFPPFPAINGARDPSVIRMRPGAVERWRVLNGSVDGAGTKRFMVLKGQYTTTNRGTFRVVSETVGEGDNAKRKRRLEPVSDQELEAAKMDLQQLSFDGITLVRERQGKAEHYIRDLSKLNAGTTNPLFTAGRPGETPAQTGLRGIEDCYRSGDTLRRALVRPNEVLMTNANRTDLFFRAPLDADGTVYTIFAAESRLHTDTHHNNLQLMVAMENPPVRRPGFDVAVAYVHVTGNPVEGGEFDIQSLAAKLPPVPPLLQPVAENELQVGQEEARRSGVAAGSRRTRTLAYTGTGATDFPVTPCPPGYAERHADMKYRLWMEHDGVEIVLPQISGTMGIHPDFDLRFNPAPGPSRKFVAFDAQCPKMLVDTAEEWVVYNLSQTMWSHTDLERFPQPGAEPPFRYRSYPLLRREGQERFAQDPEFRISNKGNDHPFHIHVNPMWVMRIDVPDENGTLHNVLPEPCWMDAAAIPRNGGRIVFRSRFEDFTGQWINHCHILAHEDNGMMQMLECVDDPAKTNYRPREQAATHAMSGPEVDAIYPRPSLELMYRQNLSFIDPSHIGGYEFPGFEIEVPKLKDS